MCLSIYILQLKHNKHQVIWLLQKVRRPVENGHGYKTFQEFLDNQQYSRSGILRYEKVFGRAFVSTGGMKTTKVINFLMMGVSDVLLLFFALFKALHPCQLFFSHFGTSSWLTCKSVFSVGNEMSCSRTQLHGPGEGRTLTLRLRVRRFPN